MQRGERDARNGTQKRNQKIDEKKATTKGPVKGNRAQKKKQKRKIGTMVLPGASLSTHF